MADRKNPRALSDKESEAIRHCLHSVIAGSSKNMMPDYICVPKSGRACLLYDHATCQKYEAFRTA
jgi:hypothetical protein